MVQVRPSKLTRSTPRRDACATSQLQIDQPRAAECAPLRAEVPSSATAVATRSVLDGLIVRPRQVSVPGASPVRAAPGVAPRSRMRGHAASDATTNTTTKTRAIRPFRAFHTGCLPSGPVYEPDNDDLQWLPRYSGAAARC